MTERVRVELVYVGKCTTTDGKQAWEFRQIMPDGTLAADSRVYGKIKGVTMPSTAGIVYSVEIATPEDPSKLTIYPGTFRYERAWEDDDQRRAWQAADATFHSAKMAEKMRAKAIEDANALNHTLNHLREAYSQVPFAQKPAFIAMVVSAIMRG